MARVLLVDDEPNIVKLTAFHLRRQGYEVVSAGNGAAGLALIQDARPDLVVLDVMMPVMDGFEMLRILRETPTTRDIPVILLTCRTLDEDIAHGMQQGADLYITKPFDMNKLLLAVRRLLDVTQGEQAPLPTTD